MNLNQKSRIRKQESEINKRSRTQKDKSERENPHQALCTANIRKVRSFLGHIPSHCVSFSL